MLSTLRRQTGTGLRLLIVLTVLCGIAYPLAVWGVSRLPGLSGHAEGSLVTQGGTVAGSSLVGVDPVPADPAADPYFHTRPSASAEGVLGPADPTTSGGSNKAGDSAELLDTVAQRRALIAGREGVATEAVPTDAVTASASGLDPDISPAYAALQVDRVARVTGLPADRVRDLVARATDGRILGFLGEPTVNVTELNLAVAAQRSGG
ncbi:potassium-transporting ATPase subunit C [Pseudonocardia halophobica]|uniref:Potassium-transporting ATPase KdpC subunit n=1 Tax=Pseudonocardia halophobica TaxID=29401 RepID=A0A9W6NWQ1_9PSEU|nr:K(+)-transporting ATPase subunit C [Pseudonocardia halophobica]GLL12610.1 potassium-transporting ATPase KdpC subunit [Pseudonocardia halophobica]